MEAEEAEEAEEAGAVAAAAALDSGPPAAWTLRVLSASTLRTWTWTLKAPEPPSSAHLRRAWRYNVSTAPSLKTRYVA